MKLNTLSRLLLFGALALLVVLVTACAPLELPGNAGPTAQPAGPNATEIVGVVRAIEPQRIQIGNQTIRIEAQSEIREKIRVGDVVKA
ncbi:MAG: hypothetical protein NZM11_08085, partial [Anaerolineales bacterium]|nr:hypothetical protein [Anaerolineales bacterium]